MTNLYHRKLSLAGLDVARLTVDDLKALVKELLDGKIHGICFSPYIEGQGPGTQLSRFANAWRSLHPTRTGSAPSLARKATS